MTHDVEIVERINQHLPRHLVRLDITSLDSAGVEQFDPTTEEADSGDDRRVILNYTGASTLTVNVVDQEDESLHIVWDSVDEELKVKNLSDGTDVANNTDVGEVLLEVFGDG
jgi:hypothetical protein